MKRSTLDNAVCFLMADANGVIKLHASGTSMAPAIKNNQRLLFTCFNSLSPGHCYLFRYNGELVTHRLVACSNNVVYFIGDNSRKIEAVDSDSIIAEMIDRHYPLFRYGVNALNGFCFRFLTVYTEVPRHLNILRTTAISVLHGIDICFSGIRNAAGSTPQPRIGT